MKLSALVLAAGEGKRLRPLTSTRPKGMIFAAGKPLLEHLIENIKPYAKDITIVIGWHGEKIRDYFGNGSRIGIKINYIEQKEMKGTAHAIGLAEFKNPFLCINGDIVFNQSAIKKALDFYTKCKSAVITAVKTDSSREFGIVKIKDNEVKDIAEKTDKFDKCKSSFVNAGLYIFTPEIFNAIRKTKLSRRGEYEITESIKILLETQNIFSIVLEEPWLDIGRPWDLLDANEFYLKNITSQINGKIEKNVTIEGNIILGSGSIVRSGSYIAGPVFIGKNCDIGPNCFIRKYTSIDSNCRIGNAVEIKNSVIMKNTKVPHHNYVGDSIISENCNFGAGTKIANLRFDEQEIWSFVNTKRVNSGRKKLGAIIGDNVKTGINSMIDAGTVIYENTHIGPGIFAKGLVMKNSKVH